MRLDVNGKSVAKPAAADIARAILQRRSDGDWSMRLMASETDCIEADWTAGDNYRVTWTRDGRSLDGNRQTGAEELQEIFTAYLAGNAKWRERMAWEPRQGGAGNAKSDFIARVRAFVPLLVVVAGLVAAWKLLPGFYAGALASIEGFRFPAAIDSIQARFILGLFSICVLATLVAVLAKGWQVRQAASWRKTKGRIVASREAFVLDQPFKDEMPKNRRVAEVDYEFAVDGKTYHGKRISFAEKIPEDKVAKLVATYAKGTTVDVYYDAQQPGEAVLERDFAGGVTSGCLPVLGIGAVATVVAMWGATRAPDLIKMGFANAVVPVVGVLGGGGLLVGGIGLGILKGQRAAQRWPKVTGRVVLSRVETYYSEENTKMYKPIVEYAYSVTGKSFKSRSVELDTETGGSEGYAAGIVAKYPAGKSVPVFYDPGDPSHAALETGSAAGYWVLAVAAVLFVGAAWGAGAFTDGPPLVLR
jgi:hypothetical protein